MRGGESLAYPPKCGCSCTSMLRWGGGRGGGKKGDLRLQVAPSPRTCTYFDSSQDLPSLAHLA